MVRNVRKKIKRTSDKKVLNKIISKINIADISSIILSKPLIFRYT